jgi:uncharacterized membrane protein
LRLRLVCALLLFVCASLWAGAILAAPRVLQHRLAIAPLLAYPIGSVICHQQPDRSFWFHDTPYPVCARCTGLYVAAPFGILAMLLTRRAFSLREWRLLLSLAAVPTVVSIVLERAGGPTGLTSRALAALPLGAAAAAFVAVAILGHFARGDGRMTGPQPHV